MHARGAPFTVPTRSDDFISSWDPLIINPTPLTLSDTGDNCNRCVRIDMHVLIFWDFFGHCQNLL